MTTVDELRRTGYEISQAIAPTWESRRAEIEEVAGPVSAWMVRELAPRPGDTVLELAAGVGDTGFAAAHLVGSNGRLICTDFSPAMLDAARRRGGELGLRNVDYRLVDAERIDLDSDSVDGVLCRYGYMLMADPAAALSETRRVLRPGGRLALAVWGAPERNPFFSVIAIALVQRGHLPAPDPSGPGIFSLASPELLTSVLEAAGFTEARAEEVPVRFGLSDVGEYLGLVADTAGPLGLALQRLPEGERDAVKAEVEGAFARFASEGDYEVPGVAVCAVAS